MPTKTKHRPSIFDGYCPACNLKEKQEQLRLNSNDFFECQNKDRKQQLTTFAPYAAILRWRGEGKFRQTEDYAHNITANLYLPAQAKKPGITSFPIQGMYFTTGRI
jgi:hypothetical protein